MRQVAHALKSLKTQHKGYPLAALQSQVQTRCKRNKETTVELEARDTQHTRFTHKTTPPNKVSDKASDADSYTRRLHEIEVVVALRIYGESSYMVSLSHSHITGRSDSLASSGVLGHP